MDAREERLAKNEIVFRDVNERIEKMALEHAEALREKRDLGFLCECSNVDCTLRLQLTLTEYEQARSDATQFVVAVGDELPEIEEVVFVADTYQLVVSKAPPPRSPRTVIHAGKAADESPRFCACSQPQAASYVGDGFSPPGTGRTQ